MNLLLKAIRELHSLISSHLFQQDILQKEILNFKETAKYLGISESTLYHYTSERIIPHYKPFGKILLFYREELKKFVLSKRVNTKDEITKGGKS